MSQYPTLGRSPGLAPGWVEPPPPSSGHGRLAWILVGAVVLALLAGGGVVAAVALTRSGDPAAAPPTPTGAGTAAGPATTPPPVPTPQPRLALVPLLLAKPPGATTNQMYGSTEPSLTIERAAGGFYVDAAGGKEYLQSLGYSSGAVRAWSVGSEKIQIALCQFADTDDATDFARGIQDDTADTEEREAVPTGGTYLAITKPADPRALYVGVAILTRGSVAIMIVTATSTKDRTRARAFDLAAQQYARIPA